MVLIDVNVLVYAHREDAPEHRAYLQWLTATIEGDEAYGVSDLVLSGLLRVTTHPKVFARPSKLPDALAFANAVRDQPNCVVVGPGARHWEIFADLCERAGVKGNLVPDAYLAALAIESGRKLPRQVDTAFLDSDGLGSRGMKVAGGTRPSASCGRCSL